MCLAGGWWVGGQVAAAKTTELFKKVGAHMSVGGWGGTRVGPAGTVAGFWWVGGWVAAGNTTELFDNVWPGCLSP